jgi:methyl-accepting chemotaxis protein
MKWFMGLSLATKLLTTFVTLALITAGVGVYGLQNIGRVGELAGNMYQNNLVAIDSLSSSYSRFLVYTRSVTRLPSQTPEEVKETRARMAEHWANSEKAFGVYANTELDAEEKALIERMKQADVTGGKVC